MLFLDYLVSLVPEDHFLQRDGLGRWGCILFLNVAMSYLTYRGLRRVMAAVGYPHWGCTRRRGSRIDPDRIHLSRPCFTRGTESVALWRTDE